MTWVVSNLFPAVSISLLVCRLLFELFSRIGAPIRLTADPLLVLAVDVGLILFAMLALREGYMARAAQAVQAERQRIASDLHDGLGFHLMTALSLARGRTELPPDVRLALELAIVELHSVVHFVHSKSIPVVGAMASLRYRLQPVIERQGLQLVWHVDNNIPDDVLVGTPAYHFIKVVQEALSNVLQHAQASRLEVKLKYPSNGTELVLEVIDNGRGLHSAGDSGSSSQGRGLAGMHRRAKLMGARLKVVELQEGGTCIRLAVPRASRRDGGRGVMLDDGANV